MYTQEIASTRGKCKVIIADDHPAFRFGLSTFIGRYSKNFEVIADASDGTEAYNLCNSLNPDILILDLNFASGGPNGFSVISKLRNNANPVKILVLSGDEFIDPSNVLNRGADMFLDKNASIEEIITGLNRLSSQSQNNKVQAQLPESNPVIGQGSSHSNPRKSVERLTRRELEVLGELGLGCTNNTIATKLGIDTRTVGNHLSSIYVKLDSKSRNEAIVFAVQNKSLIETALANAQKIS